MLKLNMTENNFIRNHDQLILTKKKLPKSLKKQSIHHLYLRTKMK